jgi:hypothetical protein
MQRTDKQVFAIILHFFYSPKTHGKINKEQLRRKSSISADQDISLATHPNTKCNSHFSFNRLCLGVQDFFLRLGSANTGGSTGNLFAAVFNTHSVQTQGLRGGDDNYSHDSITM